MNNVKLYKGVVRYVVNMWHTHTHTLHHLYIWSIHIILFDSMSMLLRKIKKGWRTSDQDLLAHVEQGRQYSSWRCARRRMARISLMRTVPSSKIIWGAMRTMITCASWLVALGIKLVYNIWHSYTNYMYISNLYTIISPVHLCVSWTFCTSCINSAHHHTLSGCSIFHENVSHIRTNLVSNLLMGPGTGHFADRTLGTMRSAWNWQLIVARWCGCSFISYGWCTHLACTYKLFMMCNNAPKNHTGNLCGVCNVPWHNTTHQYMTTQC